jgi:hypothetical protein
MLKFDKYGIVVAHAPNEESICLKKKYMTT